MKIYITPKDLEWEHACKGLKQNLKAEPQKFGRAQCLVYRHTQPSPIFKERFVHIFDCVDGTANKEQKYKQYQILVSRQFDPNTCSQKLPPPLDRPTICFPLYKK